VGSTPTRGIFVICPDKLLLISYQGCCDTLDNSLYEAIKNCVCTLGCSFWPRKIIILPCHTRFIMYTPDILLVQEPSPYITDMINRATQDNKLEISRCKTDACRTIKKYRFNKFWKPMIRTHNITENAINCASKSCRAIRKKIKTVKAQTKTYYDDHCRPMRMRKSREKCIAEKNVNFLKLINQHTDCLKSKCAAAYKKFRKTIKVPASAEVKNPFRGE